VEYLLISGQASILYGAATFSEDVDLWIRPVPASAARLLAALADCRARVYKLTPPLKPPFLGRGHGFHFTVPGHPQRVYLDVLGRPPRVGSFDSCLRRARIMETGWGRLPVVSIEDLIALKETRRLYDYEVISNLVQGRVAREESPSRPLLEWAARHSYRAEDRAEFLRRAGRRATVAECRRRIAEEVRRLQARDAAYWRPIVGELRDLRRRGKLIEEGTPVADLLRGRP
jgi:hypothetical protein